MSNKFDKQEIIDKGAELKINLATVLVDLQGTKNSVDYILNNAEFKGEFAENTKSYYTEVHGKAIEILTTLLEAIQLAGDKLKQNADTLDSDNSAKIDTDYLANEQKSEIQTAQEAYTTHKAVIQGQMSGVGDIISLSMPSENFGDKTEDAKKELLAITTKVDEFSSNSVVNEISALVANFDSLMAYMDSCQTENGNVKYAAGDLGKQPWYADIDKNVEKSVEAQMKEDIKRLPMTTSNSDDINRWIREKTLKYGPQFLDKLKEPSLWVGTGASVATEKFVQKIAEEIISSGEINTAVGKAVTSRVITQQGIEGVARGTKLAKYGSKIGNGVGFGIGMAFDLYQGKTVGEAVTHNALTTGAGIVGAALIFGTNPVGWAAAGALTVSILVGVTADVLYTNNVFGIKDGCDFVGHKIDDGIKAAGEGLKNVGNSIGGALQSLNPFNWGH